MSGPSANLALVALGIPHTVFRHAGEVTSLEQAARERGQRPEQVVRSILFRLAADEYVLVLVAGPVQIPWQALRRHFGRSRLTMATEDEVFEVTGFRVGTVSPFGLRRPVPVLLDQGVLHEADISLGSGERNVALLMKSADLRRALPDATMVDLF
jgi:prolyl-tRNA editing enzyme YbaK/EbsC (Cys-tRNA(Pro) deacylase)